MSLPRPWPKGQPHPTRGTRHPWAGSWGGFNDGRSKLSRLATRIELEELASHPSGRLREEVARLRAVKAMLVEALGHDPKVTVRRLGSLSALEGRQFTRLEQLASRARRTPETPAELLASMERDSRG